MSVFKFWCWFAAILASSSFSASAGEGGRNPLLDESFTFRLGGAWLNGSIQVQSDVKGGGVSDPLDLGTLGVDSNKASPYFGARWRFSDSFDARFEYFGWSDAGSGSAQGDIEFGDIRIPAGVQASADFKADIYALSLGWTFLKSERAELGVGLGLHVADTKASVSGSGFIGDTAFETV